MRSNRGAAAQSKVCCVVEPHLGKVLAASLPWSVGVGYPFPTFTWCTSLLNLCKVEQRGEGGSNIWTLLRFFCISINTAIFLVRVYIFWLGLSPIRFFPDKLTARASGKHCTSFAFCRWPSWGWGIPGYLAVEFSLGVLCRCVCFKKFLTFIY